jgi:hypothetical protein
MAAFTRTGRVVCINATIETAAMDEMEPSAAVDAGQHRRSFRSEE